MRPIFLLTAAVVLMDTLFFAAVAPLLPEYTEDLDLSKTGAGILSASYAAGALVGSLPAGWLTARLGAKRTVLGGLLLVAGATFVFGFGDNVVVLDVARFLQGVGGAGMWAGGMAWLISATPPERRGELIGAAMAAVVVGVLLGPVIGGLATVLGSELVFSTVAGVTLALAVWALVMPGVPPEPGHTVRDTAAHLLSRPILIGLWFVMVPALFSGVIQVLAPLRLDELGASGAAIGAVFLVTAVVEGFLSPLAGRVSDTRGRLFPIRLGLIAATLMAVVAPLPHTFFLLAAVVLLSFSAFAGLWAPATAIISDASESLGIDQGYAFALVNLAWAIGQVIGGAAGGALADASSDYLPYGTLAVVCAATLFGAMTLGRDSQLNAAPTR